MVSPNDKMGTPSLPNDNPRSPKGPAVEGVTLNIILVMSGNIPTRIQTFNNNQQASTEFEFDLNQNFFPPPQVHLVCSFNHIITTISKQNELQSKKIASPCVVGVGVQRVSGLFRPLPHCSGKCYQKTHCLAVVGLLKNGASPNREII